MYAVVQIIESTICWIEATVVFCYIKHRVNVMQICRGRLFSMTNDVPTLSEIVRWEESKNNEASSEVDTSLPVQHNDPMSAEHSC